MATFPVRFCGSCGSDSLHPHSAREVQCQKCGYRHFLTPVPAAGVLIVDRSNRLLVIRRAHEPGLGKLGLPGGAVDPGESAEQAAVREAQEEVGITVQPEQLRYLASFHNCYHYQEFDWPTIDLFYFCRIDSFPVSLRAAPSEVSEILLMPVAEVPCEAFAFSSNARAVEVLRRRES